MHFILISLCHKYTSFLFLSRFVSSRQPRERCDLKFVCVCICICIFCVRLRVCACACASLTPHLWIEFFLFSVLIIAFVVVVILCAAFSCITTLSVYVCVFVCSLMVRYCHRQFCFLFFFGWRCLYHLPVCWLAVRACVFVVAAFFFLRTKKIAIKFETAHFARNTLINMQCNAMQ